VAEAVVVAIVVGASITCDIAGVKYVRLTAATSVGVRDSPPAATPPAPWVPLNDLSVEVEDASPEDSEAEASV